MKIPMPLYCNWIETYKNKDGKYIFVYVVSVNETEKEDFMIKQGVYYRETPNGRPKYQTPIYGGKRAKLIQTFDQSRYILDNSEFDKLDSLSKQQGENANIELAEKFNDINWILDLENKMLMKPENIKLSNEQEKRKAELTEKLKLIDKDPFPESLFENAKNYFESDDVKTGFTFLNEWHFAAYVKKNLSPKTPLVFKIIHLADRMLDPFFSGILEDADGTRYNIEGDENIWLFEELLTISKIKMHANLRDGKLTLEIYS